MIAPQERPNIGVLRQIGFSGSDEQVVERAARQAPQLLSAASSASSMWVANAATVSPSADTLDGKVHLTVANLNNKFHRASEAPTTESVLRAMFRDSGRFTVHGALPQVALFGDEGAANHNRLGGEYGDPGVQLFVYGREDSKSGQAPARYPARQSAGGQSGRSAFESGTFSASYFRPTKPGGDRVRAFFTTMVIAVSNREVLFCHQHAFVDQQGLYQRLREKSPGFYGP
ncbi:N-succinylarginine dihydrolase [Cedecea neteri]|uniref:N-succinylarginine dihydrolase n=1 Tax=Cedecea neteri TaxID=158822 RepID=A0A2X3KZF1_9ENTR|nr:N-succinylarginine dihydrolase [Cedecea neteri]